jgi:hypothetical protein
MLSCVENIRRVFEHPNLPRMESADALNYECPDCTFRCNDLDIAFVTFGSDLCGN